MNQKIAALFSGQGSQYPGMGKSLYESSLEARRVYECAGDILGFDVAGTSFEGSADELARTLISQPVIFTLSMAAWEAAKGFIPPICAVAGHSLGEFSALCCAGTYSLEDGFRLIRMRASAMEEEAAGLPVGAMYAVIGLDAQSVAEACEEARGFIFPVNFNMAKQTVISGEEEAAERAAGILAGKGARIVKLGVSNAFHTSMMASAAQRFRRESERIVYSPPLVDFYSNLTGGKYAPEDFPDYFAKHMVSPVRFVEQTGAMAEDGAQICVEFGPGKNVSSMMKKNARTLSVTNVEDMEGLEALKKTVSSY